MVTTEEINGTGFYQPGTQELVRKHPCVRHIQENINGIRKELRFARYEKRWYADENMKRKRLFS
jgi:hypothetical protein